jgi:hypothetical protein
MPLSQVARGDREGRARAGPRRPRAERGVIANDFAFRGRSAANKLSKFRESRTGGSASGTTRTERARAGPARRRERPGQRHSPQRCLALGTELGQMPQQGTAMARSALPGEATARSGLFTAVAARAAAGADPSRRQAGAPLPVYASGISGRQPALRRCAGRAVRRLRRARRSTARRSRAGR